MNNIKNNKKILLKALASLLSIQICGCTNDDRKPITLEEIEVTDVNLNPSEVIEIEEIPKTYEIIEIPSIKATTDVKIRDGSSTDYPTMGILKEGESIKKLDKLDNGWYQVDFYTRVAYVSGEYAIDSVIYDITGEIIKTCYTTENIEVAVTNELNGKGNNSLVSIPKYECVEIYEETDDYYLVKTSEYIGYIEKQVLDKYLIDELEPNYEIVNVPSITATEKVSIHSSANNGAVIGTLIEGDSLKVLNKLDKWYEVEYCGNTGYVSGNYVYESSYYDITGDILKLCYSKEEVELTIPSVINSMGIDEKVTIPKLECFEVYYETDNIYLVKTSDYIGYVGKENLEQLNGTLITVDISDQVATMYENNEIILETPVVTGNLNKGYSTHQGLFEIYSIRENTYLIGEDYKTHVDYMASFYAGEGLHDAPWKVKIIYTQGRVAYISNGSHGCVNMIPDAAFEVQEHSEVGTRVLVKE